MGTFEDDVGLSSRNDDAIMASMPQAVSHLWELVESNPRVDVDALARAIEEAAADAEDYRTQLLIRDSVNAIEGHWGKPRTQRWLQNSAQGERIRQICDLIVEEAGHEQGFPSLRRRLVDAIQPNKILQYLRDLSVGLNQSTRLIIGGSISLILSGHLIRKTDDVDIVDEVPAALRTRHELLAELEDEYGLKLTHFQSHYLPRGWENRIHSVGTFGNLQAFTIDGYDVFLTKLFSSRRKDKEDLRVLMPKLDKEVLLSRLVNCTADLRGETKLLEAAKTNWYVLFGEELPA